MIRICAKRASTYNEQWNKTLHNTPWKTMTQLNVRETLTKTNHHGQEKEEKKISSIQPGFGFVE